MQSYFLKQDNKRNRIIKTHFLSPYLYLSRPEFPPPLAIILSKQHKRKRRKKLFKSKTLSIFALLMLSAKAHKYTTKN